jgi:putative membrane protein insertion efficiency factor
VSTPSPALSPHGETLGARALSGAIRAYQVVRRGRPSPCRFEPSCSVYAHEAVVTHGAVRGSVLALRRLSRCRPLGGRGWDPVPAPPPRKAA